MMKNRLYSIICMIMAFMMTINIGFVAFAEENQFVNNVNLNGEFITLSGKAQSNEFVSIFLLNPGKTVQDLNNAMTNDLYKSCVNYSNIITTDNLGNFSESFQINNYSEGEKYLLYVKAKDESHSQYIAASKNIYVSTSGNDETGDGSAQKPYKTINKARLSLRGEELTAPASVIISGGEYNLSEGLVFDAADSGTAECPITYNAEEGERVLLKGTTKLDTSKIRTVGDADILARLEENIREKVVEIDLTEQGIPVSVVSFLEKLKVGRTGKPMGVYLNGEPQTISRWPNVGYETILSGSTEGGILGKTESSGGATVKINGLDSERAEKWKNSIGNMYVEGYLAKYWYSEWAKVGSIDSSSPSITLNTYTQYGVKEGFRIAVVNALEEIDVPGEWFVDSNAMKMYYYPPHTLTSDDNLEIATLLDNLISVKGAEYINFKGIEFAGNVDNPSAEFSSITTGNGIVVTDGANNINISQCIFRDIGIDGIVLNGAENITVNGCLFYNLGFSAMLIDCGNRTTQTPGNITVKNCVISDIARDAGANGISGIRLRGVGNTVENNIFHNMKNAAIVYQGNGHTIRKNEIYNAVNETSDAGAVYAGRNWTNYGTKIENNYFHDIGAGIDSSYQASAVFWDDNHSGNSLIGNIIAMNNTTKSSALKIGGGRDNVVDGNIFVNSAYGIFGEDRTVEPKEEYQVDDENDFYNSTVFQSFKEAAADVSNAYDILEENWLEAYIQKYPNIMNNFSQIRNELTYSRVEQITNNITYNCTTDDLYIPAKMTQDSTISGNLNFDTDEIFVNPTLGDYRIKSQKKAEYGMSENVLDESFDMTSIGLQEGETLIKNTAEFSLTYPQNNSSIADTSTYLKWDKSPIADSYIYEIATDEDFSNIIKQGETKYNVVFIDGLLNEEYYWRVKAQNKSKQIGGEYISNNSFRFTTSDEIIVKEITYDKELKEVTLDVANTKSTDNTFYVIIALKDINGKLLNVSLSPQTVSKNTEKTIVVPVSFEKNSASDILEVYAWNSLNGMVGLTNKKSFCE